MIEIVNLTKKYGENLYALKDVCLNIGRGEWIAIMGPSGSGKTTLMNVLGCLDKPTSGQVFVEGTDVTRLSESQLTEFRREKIGLVFQQLHLIPY
ncbi:MAG TPA: ATP-binding cassette domain-containing protein, partial [Blastocatellia bacterium]|nr:ATP-binding cassette domain-containing protein [Blastocatellia bacterium]